MLRVFLVNIREREIRLRFPGAYIHCLLIECDRLCLLTRLYRLIRCLQSPRIARALVARERCTAEHQYGCERNARDLLLFHIVSPVTETQPSQ